MSEQIRYIDVSSDDLHKLVQLALRACSYDFRHARNGMYKPELAVAVRYYNELYPNKPFDIDEYMKSL